MNLLRKPEKMGEHSTSFTRVARIRQFQWHVLPVFDPAGAALFKSLARKTRTVKLAIGTRSISLELDKNARPTPPLALTEAQIGAHRALIWSWGGLFEQIVETHDCTANRDVLTPDIRAIVLEHLLTPVVQMFEDSFGQSVQLISHNTTHDEVPPMSLLFRIIGTDSSEAGFAISGPTDLLLRVAELCRATEEEQASSQFNPAFLLKLFGPKFGLDQSEFDSLTVGDGIITELPWAETSNYRVEVSGRLSGEAKCRDNKITLSSTLSKIPASNLESKTMSKEAALNQVNSDSLDVVIAIVLDRKKILLSELKKLTVGDALPFGAELPKLVDLTANGVRFGQGELVQYDEKIAVRLTKIY